MIATEQYYINKIAELKLALDAAALNTNKWRNALFAVVELHRHKDGVGNCVSCGHQYPCATFARYLDAAYETEEQS